MNTLRFLIAFFALGSAVSAFACDVPADITIPPGDTATLDDMLAAQASVRDYIAAMEEYLACMDQEMEAMPEETPEEERTQMVEQYNTGVDQMEAVAADFNEQRVLFQENAAADN